MRIFISILICLTVLLQSLSKTMIAYNFSIHQKTIAENFCENKSKPLMHCHGSCMLKKQLASDEKRQNSSAPVKEKYEIQFFSSPCAFQFITPAFENNLFNSLSLVRLPGHPSPVFHPPLARIEAMAS